MRGFDYLIGKVIYEDHVSNQVSAGVADLNKDSSTEFWSIVIYVMIYYVFSIFSRPNCLVYSNILSKYILRYNKAGTWNHDNNSSTSNAWDMRISEICMTVVTENRKH